MKCRACYNHDGNLRQTSHGAETRKLFYKIEFIRQSMEIFKDLSVEIFGGEPFVSKEELYFLLEYLFKKNIPVFIVTNGILLNEKTVKRIAKYGNLLLLVSFHSYRERGYNLYTNSKGNYPILAKNLKLLVKYNIDFKLTTALMRLNENYIVDQISFFKESFNRPVYLSFINPTFNNTDWLKLQIMAPAQIQETLLSIRKNHPDVLSDIDMEYVFDYYDGRCKGQPCDFMSKNLILNNNGVLNLCFIGDTLPFDFFELPDLSSYMEYIYPKNRELQTSNFCKNNSCQILQVTCREKFVPRYSTAGEKETNLCKH